MPSIATIAADHATRRDPRWVFPESSLEWTLRGIVERSRRFAAVLRDLGVRADDRVGLLLDNCPDYVPLLLAIWHLGAAAVPLRTLAGRWFSLDRSLERVDAECDLGLLVASDSVAAEVLAGWRRRSPRPALYLGALTALAQSAPPLVDGPYDAPAGALALIQYSSGSTGRPKGVMVTHGMALSQLAEINHNVARGCRGKRVRASASWLPFNHDMGRFIGILNPLFLGAENLLASPRFYMMRPRRWYELMSAQRSDLTFTTNTAIKAALRPLSRIGGSGAEPPIDLGNLFCYLAAEKIHPAVLRQACAVFAAHGMQPHQFRIGYGMAENALGATSTADGPIRIGHFRVAADGVVTAGTVAAADSVELVAVGRSHDGVQVSIRDDAGSLLPDDRLGEICIDGPCVTPGYWRNPEATARALDGRRLRTGDLGFQHGGELWFHSRKDDLVVVGGRNIDPADVEHAVEELGFVRPNGSALFTLPDQDDAPGGLVLLVESRARPGDGQADDQRTAVQTAVHCGFDLLLPDVRFCDSGTIETTSSGKKRRRVIRERLCAGAFATY